MKTYTLNNGQTLPAIGFGTYTLTDPATAPELITGALALGYKLVDTAYFYKNEALVGRGLVESGVSRDRYQLATKVWPSDFGAEATKRSIERSLKDLKTDYLDLLYLHWPGDDALASWKVFEDYCDQGVIKTLGVCNFHAQHMDELLASCNTPPAVNQIEAHPRLPQKSLIAANAALGIQVVSFSPLYRGKEGILEDPTLCAIADKHGKTPAQVVLRWHLEKNIIPIPRSSHLQRIGENIDIDDFALDDRDMAAIAAFETGDRVSASPEDCDWLTKIRYDNQ